MTNQWNAAEYDAKHAFVYEKAKGLVELLAPKAGERVLDLGCGTGALTAEIAARVPRGAVGVFRPCRIRVAHGVHECRTVAQHRSNHGEFPRRGGGP